jgi:AbrB family looped-hinge helix DNA binding protein
MRTTIDRAGRIVVPKSLRDAMGLAAGREIDIVFTDGRLEIELAPMAAHIERRGKVAVIVPDAKAPELTDEQVRQAIEATRL